MSPQMPLQRLELLAVLKTDDEIGIKAILDHFILLKGELVDKILVKYQRGF